MPVPTPQDRQTQSAQAADEILRRVAMLELAPGATFTERELAELLQMGRVPVREALLRLSSSGLLSPRTGSGYTVTPITLRAAHDVFDAWRVVEPAAVDLAITRGVGSAFAKGIRDVQDSSVPEPLGELQFHLGLVTAGGNEHLVRSHPGVAVVRLLVLATQHGQPAPGCGGAAHAEILDALAAGDRAAVRLTGEAIEAVRTRVLETLSGADSLQGVNVHS